jgi:hypothetical protein
MHPTHSDHITRVRQAATQLLSAVDALRALERESVALDLNNALTVEDFAGNNAHLDTVKISAVTGTTLAAIEALLAAGHATNLYGVRT